MSLRPMTGEVWRPSPPRRVSGHQRAEQVRQGWASLRSEWPRGCLGQVGAPGVLRPPRPGEGRGQWRCCRDTRGGGDWGEEGCRVTGCARGRGRAPCGRDLGLQRDRLGRLGSWGSFPGPRGPRLHVPPLLWPTSEEIQKQTAAFSLTLKRFFPGLSWMHIVATLPSVP